MTNKLQTKKAPSGRQWIDLGFRPASDIELKAVADGMGVAELPEGYVAGWASTSNVDTYGHAVLAGAFDESIRKKGLTGPKGIRLLLQHDRDKIAGVIKVLRTINGALWIEAEMALQLGYVSDYYKAAKLVGGVNFSVGFYLEDYRFEERDGEDVLVISRGELEEVSVVTFPGNQDAVMTFIKEAPDDDDGVFDTIAELEKALVVNGLVKSRNVAARLTQVVKKNLALYAPTKKTAPVAKERLDAISALVGELNALF